MKIQGRTISPGKAEGRVLKLTEPLSFLGGVDGSTGELRVGDGGNVAGRVLVFPKGKGSTVGSFVMLFEAFRRGQTQLAQLVSSVTGLYDNRLFIGNLFEFLDLEPSIVNAPNAKPFPLQVKSVEFRDITFRYPKMERDVLSHFNLTARAGEVTQIEGENGFGKTTLLKLLLRLYDTDQGAVLVDGVDVRQYDLKGLRHGIGAIFQDYVRFY